MTIAQQIAFKIILKQAAITIIEKRIQNLGEHILNARQGAQQEQKSSAGDKYETAQAMGHLEEEMLSRQMNENVKELAHLHQVPADIIQQEAISGACIKCPEVIFFIAAGLGKQVMEDKLIYFISPTAPLAKTLVNKKVGDSIILGGLSTAIQAIF